MNMYTGQIVMQLLLILASSNLVYGSEKSSGICHAGTPLKPQRTANEVEKSTIRERLELWTLMAAMQLSFHRGLKEYSSITDVSCSFSINKDFEVYNVRVKRSSHSKKVDDLVVKLLTARNVLPRPFLAAGRQFEVDFLPRNPRGKDVLIRILE